MDLCNASQELFCVFGDLYVPGVQDVARQQIHCFFIIIFFWRNIVMLDWILKK